MGVPPWPTAGYRRMPDRGPWSIILHGGAKTIPAKEEEESRSGLRDALRVGRAILVAGGSALDAVEATVRKLEELPAFNAGVGSVKNEEGEVELDASIMDGASLDIGAVAGLQSFKHPVSVARALLREKTILLVGAGAQKFAEARGAERLDLERSSKSNEGSDTVGCVALDQVGNLAVATSTGGLEGAMAGRVGDVPLPGCGFYADNQRGALSVSGEGEAIARVLLASEALELMGQKPVQTAVDMVLHSLEKVSGQGGLIALTPSGEFGWAHNSSHFAVALASHSLSGEGIFLKKDEAR
jgi:beta-aspartyl-peptidase (threonine type)